MSVTHVSPVIYPRLTRPGAAEARADHAHQAPHPRVRVLGHERAPGVSPTRVPAPRLVPRAHHLPVDVDLDAGIPGDKSDEVVPDYSASAYQCHCSHSLFSRVTTSVVCSTLGLVSSVGWVAPQPATLATSPRPASPSPRHSGWMCARMLTGLLSSSTATSNLSA